MQPAELWSLHPSHRCPHRNGLQAHAASSQRGRVKNRPATQDQIGLGRRGEGQAAPRRAHRGGVELAVEDGVELLDVRGEVVHPLLRGDRVPRRLELPELAVDWPLPVTGRGQDDADRVEVAVLLLEVVQPKRQNKSKRSERKRAGPHLTHANAAYILPKALPHARD